MKPRAIPVAVFLAMEEMLLGPSVRRRHVRFHAAHSFVLSK
jgi:hypothetical protein